MSVEDRLKRLYAALAGMKVTERLPSMRPTTHQEGHRADISFDFTNGIDPATAANRVSLLLNNIACLKDHLRQWCNKNGKAFTGEELLGTNRDAAIIHDLWNWDKHGESNRNSRSGFHPRIGRDAHTALVLKGDSKSNRVGVTIPLVGGGSTQVYGDASLRIVATVVDMNGNQIGDLEPIALRAIAAWEAEFAKVGIKLDPLPQRL
jgi:hypothetical protein